MRKFNSKMLLPLLFFLFATFPVTVLSAAGPILQLAPQSLSAAGQGLVFRIRTQELLPPLQAVLNFRSLGTLPFRTLPLKKESQNEFTATLSGEQLQPPGLEYYFAVSDGQGRLFTLPAQNPQQQPLRIDLTLKDVVRTELRLPAMDGARIEARRADLAIRLADAGIPADWSAIRLTVDNVDVTQLANFDGEFIRYVPEGDFAYGSHSVSLEAMDAAGNLLVPQHWSFVIPVSDVIDSAAAQAQVDLEVAGLLLEPDRGVHPDWKVQSNLSLSAALEAGRFRASFEANGWYTEEQGSASTGDAFSLNNYLLRLEYGQQKLSIGDLQIEGTELLGDSIARRGGLLELALGKSRLQSFLLRSNAVTGFDNFSGMDDPDQRLYGGSLQQSFFDDASLVFKGTAIAGKNTIPEDYNTGSLVAGNEGEVYSLQLDSRLFADRFDLSAEYSLSHFDADISDTQDKNWAQAWRVRLAGRADSFDYGTGYKYLGQDFHSIVSPAAASNRSESTLYGTKIYEQSSLTAHLLHIRDNVDQDPLQPVVENNNLDLSYSLYQPNWPVLFVNAVLGLQESSDEPDGLVPLKNRTETIGAGFTLVRERWNLVPSYYFTRFDDQSPADNDSQTHQLNLSLGLQPSEKLSLSPSFSYSRVSDEATSVVNETWQGVLAGVVTLTATQNLNLTFSGIENKADDGSQHTTSYDTIGQYNWLWQTRFWEKLQKTVSVRGRYNRVKDRVGSSSSEDYSVYLLLSFGGTPLRLF